MEKAKAPALLCARCGRELRPGSGDLYVVKIVAVADPYPPVITEADLSDDIERDIHALLAQIRDKTEQDLMDQVYHRKILHLCTICYQIWIEDPMERPNNR